MNKDILIIGVIVVVCVGVTAVTFMTPAQAKPTTPSVATRPKDVEPAKPAPIAKPPDTDLTPPVGFDPVTNTGLNPANPLGAGGGDATFDPTARAPVTPAKPPWATPGLPAPVDDPVFRPVNPLPPVDPGPSRPLLPDPPTLDQPKMHVVAKGETGGDISMKYYGTVKNWPKIQEANPGVDATALKIGQKLTIPVVAKREAAPNGETPPLADGQAAYTVKKGDSFYVIARNELGDATRHPEIAKLNPGVSSEELHVGQKIKLPSRTRTADRAANPIDPIDPGAANVHVVKQGETLMDISKLHFGTTRHWREIEKANPGVDSENLHVGQKLKLPDAPKEPVKKGAAPVDPGTPPALGDTGDATEHVVKDGEYLSDIARKHYGNANAFDRILKANPGLDPNRMRVGQKLRIPKAPAKATEKGGDPVPRTPERKPAERNQFAPPPGGSGFGPSGFAPSSPGSGFGPGTSGFSPGTSGFGTDFGTPPSSGGDLPGAAPVGAPSPASGPGVSGSGFAPSGADLWSTPTTRPAGAGAPLPSGSAAADPLDDLNGKPRR